MHAIAPTIKPDDSSEQVANLVAAGGASLVVGSFALAFNETNAALEGRETAIHWSLKAVDRLRIEVEREPGFVAGLKQGLGVVGTGLLFSLDVAQQGYGHWGSYKW